MLYGIWGIAIILKVSIVCFILSAVMEMFIVIPFSKQWKQNKISHIVRNDLQDSLKFLNYEKPVFIQVCLVIAGLNMFLSSMITIGIPVMIIDRLGMPDQMLGITQGLLAIGGMVGGVLTVMLEKRLCPEKAFVFLFLCAAFTCIMGLGMIFEGVPLLKYVILSAMGLAVTISSAIFSIQMLAVVQTETPGNLVGKVVACIMTFIMCAQPMGQCNRLVNFYEQYPLYFVSIIGNISIDEKDLAENEILRQIYHVGEEINDNLIVLFKKGMQENYLRRDINMLPAIFTLWASLGSLITMAYEKEAYISKRMSMERPEFLQYGFQILLDSKQIVQKCNDIETVCLLSDELEELQRNILIVWMFPKPFHLSGKYKKMLSDLCQGSL